MLATGTLAQELKTYARLRPQLLRDAPFLVGKYLLIVGDELLGTFDEAGTAYMEGIARKGNVPMLIAQLRGTLEASVHPSAPVPHENR